MIPLVLLLFALIGRASSECVTNQATGYQNEDFKDTIRRAAKDYVFLAGGGATLDTGFLDRGMCFSRKDPGCEHQPSWFNFVSYGIVLSEEPIMAADWTPVEPISSVHWCPVPLENGVTMTCGAGGENSRQTAVAIANARAYTFSQGVSVGVEVGGFAVSANLGMGLSTSNTDTNVVTTTNTVTAKSEIEVEPGDCRQLIVTSLAKTREGKAAYRVPIHGKVSVWTKNRIRLPEIGDDGRPHWNWLIPLTVLVETAAKQGYADGLSTDGTDVWYDGELLLRESQFDSEATQHDCTEPVPEGAQNATGVFQPASEPRKAVNLQPTLTRSKRSFAEAEELEPHIHSTETQKQETDADAGTIGSGDPDEPDEPDYSGLEDFGESVEAGDKDSNLGLPDTDKN